MKKLTAILAVLFLCSFSTDKELSVKGKVKDWQNVLFVIEQSNAPHLQVKEAQDFIIMQLEKQIDTTKKK